MIYDVMIIGGGPAGLTAALYLKRANKSVVVLSYDFGGRIKLTPKIENYPGIPEISGQKFADNLESQISDNVTTHVVESVNVQRHEYGYFVTTAQLSFPDPKLETFNSKTVIFATGMEPRSLGLENEINYYGVGLSSCAICDGDFYKDQEVAVVGGGNTAIQDAIYLSGICKKVYVIHHSCSYRADISNLNKASLIKNIEFISDTVVEELYGYDELNSIKIKNIKNNHIAMLKIHGLFVAIGYEGSGYNLADLGIEVNKHGEAISFEGETNIPGVFVAGDCREKELKQLTTAVADGANVAKFAIDYINN